MIFPPKTVARIHNGRKTMARFPISFKPVRVGFDYPVSSPGHPAEFRVKVTSTREELAGAITLIDACLEGHRTTVEWKIDWVMRQDRAWFARALKVCGDDAYPDDELVRERFEQRHADKPVRVVTFEVQRDVDLYCATQRDILSGRENQYTTNRARGSDDLPVVAPEIVEAWAKEAREDGVRRRASFRVDLEVERRLQKQERMRGLRAAA